MDNQLFIYDNFIQIKKERIKAEHEMIIYNIIGINKFTSTFVSIKEYTNSYLILEYQLEFPFNHYLNNFSFSLFKNMIVENINKYLFDVLQAYSFLISNNIIHNDLKPQNVLLKKNGSKYILHDFDKSIVIDSKITLDEINNFIKKDFIRFLTVFNNELTILNIDIIIINESYQNFNKNINNLINNLINLNIDNFSSAQEFLDFIESLFEKLIIKGNIIWNKEIKSGGKKLKNKFILYYNKNGTHSSPNDSYKTKSGLRFHHTNRRKRTGYICGKQRNTRRRTI